MSTKEAEGARLAVPGAGTEMMDEVGIGAEAVVEQVACLRLRDEPGGLSAARRALACLLQ